MKRGPYKSKKHLAVVAIRLRMLGYGYRTIAKVIKIPWATVKGWIKHVEIGYADAYHNYQIIRKQKNISDVKSKSGRLRCLKRERGHKCQSCQKTHWLECPIPLETHHVDGDPKNNESENLQLICPNCHALTDNYKGKNIK